jgi:predicted nucleic acid-binding protein
MYLVDTSVWVDYLRGRATPPVLALRNLLAGEDIVGTAPPILQEVLQGADSIERFESWKKTFSELLCYLPADPIGSHIAAARLYVECRKSGKPPRSRNDCLIAQIAIENRLVLIHSDKDFEAIASVAGELRLYPEDGMA